MVETRRTGDDSAAGGQGRPPILSGDAVAFHDAATAAFFGGGTLLPSPEGPLWAALFDNHRNNMLLWAEEDLARRRHVPDAAIAANKRAIDGYNQARNDAVERMDDLLAAAIREPASGTARLNSETPGSIIDRLSIASLKIYHMRLQTRRDDVDAAHREDCARRLARLNHQRSDLGRCLDELVEGCLRGIARFGVYRQFKMYNDPRLNMALVHESRQDRPPSAPSLGTVSR